MLFIILFLVESDNSGHINALKDISVFIWVMAIPLPLVSVLDWSHECDKLAWDDPVQVTIFDSLIIFIFLHVEGSEVIPSESYSVFEALQDVEQGAVVEAVSLGSISVVLEQLMVWLELFVSLISSHLEDNDHKSSH